MLQAHAAVNVANPAGQPLVTGGTSHTWTVALYDNFSTLGAPDLSQWDYWEQNNDRGAELGKTSFWIRAENTTVEIEAATGTAALRRRNTTADIGYGAQQSGAGLQSKLRFGPGSFCQTTTRRGTNSAHDTDWTQAIGGMNGVPPDASSAAGGLEIDFRENISNSQQTNLFWDGYAAGNVPQSLVTDTNYHTYGLWWDVGATFYKFYVDGGLVRTFNSPVGTNLFQALRLTSECDFGGTGNCETWTTNATIWTW